MHTMTNETQTTPKPKRPTFSPIPDRPGFWRVSGYGNDWAARVYNGEALVFHPGDAHPHSVQKVLTLFDRFINRENARIAKLIRDQWMPKNWAKLDAMTRENN